MCVFAFRIFCSRPYHLLTNILIKGFHIKFLHAQSSKLLIYKMWSSGLILFNMNLFLFLRIRVFCLYVCMPLEKKWSVRSQNWCCKQGLSTKTKAVMASVAAKMLSKIPSLSSEAGIICDHNAHPVFMCVLEIQTHFLTFVLQVFSQWASHQTLI